MYDYSKLRGRIVEKYGTMSRFAEELGITLVAVSNKLNNKTGFTRADIEKWANLLEIPSGEYDAYFFAHKV
jgi:transcriptional regulator with XRE-family HTH domain